MSHHSVFPRDDALGLTRIPWGLSLNRKVKGSPEKHFSARYCSGFHLIFHFMSTFAETLMPSLLMCTENAQSVFRHLLKSFWLWNLYELISLFIHMGSFEKQLVCIFWHDMEDVWCRRTWASVCVALNSQLSSSKLIITSCCHSTEHRNSLEQLSGLFSFLICW